MDESVLNETSNQLVDSASDFKADVLELTKRYTNVLKRLEIEAHLQAKLTSEMLIYSGLIQ